MRLTFLYKNARSQHPEDGSLLTSDGQMLVAAQYRILDRLITSLRRESALLTRESLLEWWGEACAAAYDEYQVCFVAAVKDLPASGDMTTTMGRAVELDAIFEATISEVTDSLALDLDQVICLCRNSGGAYRGRASAAGAEVTEDADEGLAKVAEGLRISTGEARDVVASALRKMRRHALGADADGEEQEEESIFPRFAI